MDLVAYVNAGCAALLCGLLAWVVLNPKIQEGPVINIGVGLAALGLLCICLVVPGLSEVPTAAQVLAILAALLAVQVGTVIAWVGLYLRMRRDPSARQAWQNITGWPPLGGTAAHQSTDRLDIS